MVLTCVGKAALAGESRGWVKVRRGVEAGILDGAAEADGRLLHADTDPALGFDACRQRVCLCADWLPESYKAAWDDMRGECAHAWGVFDARVSDRTGDGAGRGNSAGDQVKLTALLKRHEQAQACYVSAVVDVSVAFLATVAEHGVAA